MTENGYSAVDMTTAAAQGFRDGVASVQQPTPSVEDAATLARRILDDGGDISATVWIEQRDVAVRAPLEARIAELERHIAELNREAAAFSKRLQP